MPEKPCTCKAAKHDVLKQDKPASCGPTCLQMAYKYLTGNEVGTSLIFSLTAITENLLRAGYDGKAVGTYGSNLAVSANGLGLSAQFHTYTMKEFVQCLGLMQAHNNCVIAFVRWASGGGHWVFAVKSTIDLSSLNQTVCMCDPYDGEVHRVTFSAYSDGKSGPLAYNPGYGSGTFGYDGKLQAVTLARAPATLPRLP
jgi:hypothetical protein